MAVGRTPKNSILVESGMQDEALYKAQLRWSVLQLRLLHRLALEALLGVVERYLYATEVIPEYLGPIRCCLCHQRLCACPPTSADTVPPLQSTVELTFA